MGSYLGRHAELYDVFYQDKDYAREACFVDGCLRDCGVGRKGRLLDLACGTGRHAFEFETLGYTVSAVDYSADMVQQAHKRAEQRGSSVSFLHQDMRELDVPSPPFDAVTCLFDSIGYVQTNDGIHKVLQGIRKHLAAKGVLVVEFWHAPAMLMSFDPVRVRRWTVPSGEVLRISETKLDVAKQLSSVTYSILELCADGTFHEFQETQTNRYFFVPEMKFLLETAGFDVLHCFAGFEKDESITSETWHVIAVARVREGTA